ncbi:type I 3-dehydroquinate dehydratase [Brevibacterium sp. UMB1308A]|uniref:type I 3-dehydroquinate dehydratase n=1 Tax=Brevibacterium sp. UMB1308A TaxID=3050608 RepID=UPI0025505D61|nr:type I 3-dehydroquinate dehydratase [Brevibacterium sp. UMB1308A]MDK8346018.1 type I 3-dehydroquinate dehydratase [Brevibacterium sp. UMB1308B]MDK8713021.1 type I 3-dehydroquinate dehydratase [Brevibacterium sp. UMB1308A]
MKPLPFCSRTPAIISSVTCTSVNDVHGVGDEWLTPGPTSPDVVEWRVDPLVSELATASPAGGNSVGGGVASEGDLGEKIAEVATALRERAQLPLIFTVRSETEGGQCAEAAYTSAVEALTQCAETSGATGVQVALDVEVARPDSRSLIEKARAQGTHVIASFHDFSATPHDLLERMRIMEQIGASVAKIAVTPTSMDDVIRVLDVTNRAQDALNIPVIAISMGRMGAVTRLMGAEFGSCATFATGPQGASAPGQYSVAQVRQLAQVLKA